MRGGGGFEGQEDHNDIAERSAGKFEAKGHFLEPWGLGRVEGPFEGLPAIYAREEALVPTLVRQGDRKG